jgi:flagellar assembly protein FliH
MADRPIIVRATPAGTRRVAPLPPLEPGGVATEVAAAPAPTGLNAFLQTAQRQGAELVAAARAQADEIAGHARAEGYAAGYQEGRGQAERELRDLFTFAEGSVLEVAEARARLLDESEQDLVRLAVQVAQRILVAELDARPERVVDVLRGALRKAFVRDHLQVICNPADLHLIETAGDDLSAHVGTLRNLELIGDRRIARGGVVVRTDAGDVDATLDGQLERLREAMLGSQDG